MWSRPAIAAREVIQVGKSQSIGVDGEHGAIAIGATPVCRPIQGAARQNQSRKRISSIGVGSGNGVSGRKIMQDAETGGLVGDDREQGAAAITAALLRGPIQGAAR